MDVPGLVRTRERFGVRPGLERIGRLLEKLGRPERTYPVIHVAGTNGKGSTSVGIAAVLAAAGYRVGLYTSPHLVSFRERFVIDGEPVSADALAAAAAAVEPAVQQVEAGGERLTEFEVGTALAFWLFRQAGVEAAVIEVGLGGRWDATNVVEPDLTVITPVSLDHTRVLGRTVAAIAGEKAGIIKPGVPLVLAPQEQSAERVIAERARQLEAPLFGVGTGHRGLVRVQYEGSDRRGARFRLEVSLHGLLESGLPGAGRDFLMAMGGRALRSALAGEHQAVNGATVATAAAVLAGRGWRLDPENVVEGLAGLRWPGRVEVVDEEPLVLLDGAHNPHSARALAQVCREWRLPAPTALVFGVLAGKPAADILKPLVPFAHHLVLTCAHGRTPGEAPAVLARRVERVWRGPVHLEADPQRALAAARSLAGPGGSVIVSGSLYLVGALRGLWPLPRLFRPALSPAPRR